VLRLASALLWFDGLGFGVCCLPALRNLASGRDIPFVLGFPAYGHGPLERIGIPSTDWRSFWCPRAPFSGGDLRCRSRRFSLSFERY